ncbi:MAG TPA: DUF1800 domain-containing protein [Planctomycetes bacterium]|nr:DUF1800 domain-containing protein [Planctomycetota bacterium]
MTPSLSLGFPFVRVKRAKDWALSLSLLFLASCGGGGGGGDPAAIQASSLRPYTGPLDLAARQHFLFRTQWGASPEDLQELERIGLDAWIDRMLAFQEPARLEEKALKELGDEDFPSQSGLVRYWLYRMLRNPNGFQEVLTYFWHDHFATSQSVLKRSSRYFFLKHLQLLRKGGAGNLRQFLKRVAKDPAMLLWLDGVSNTRLKPNENFGREFLELFTLGADRGYTQKDIEEISRAFTGYRLRYDSLSGQSFVTFDEKRFDSGIKEIFGVQGPFDMDSAIDLTIDRRGVAEWICARLFSYFCYPNPPGGLVAELAQYLRKHNYDLRPLLKLLFRSEAFFSPRARKGRVRSPLEQAIWFIRTTGLEIPLEELDDALSALGNRPTMPPHVGGWPEGEAWVSSLGLLERGNLINELCTDRYYQNRLGLNLAPILPPRGRRSAEAVLDRILMLLRVEPDPQERQLYLDFLGQRIWLEGKKLMRKRDAFDGEDPQQVDERVRGLLFLVSQHPSAWLK